MSTSKTCRLSIAIACLLSLGHLALSAHRTKARTQRVTRPRTRSNSRMQNTFAEGIHGAVATGSPQAAQAGLTTLQAGGNAVDAAVATLLVQTVVESQLYCFGGEVPIIVYDAERGVVEVIAGLGAAPALATPEWFREHRDGVIQGRDDIANAVVPGTLDACVTALDRFGTMSFSQCAQPMLAILKERAERDPEELAARSRSEFDAQGWIKHHQNFHSMIEQLCQAERDSGPDRSRGLRTVSDYFYRGPVARKIDAWSREQGGLLRFSDFAKHHTPIEEPLVSEFQGYSIYKCGVWTQGPFFHQTLRLLEDRELAAMGHHSPDYIHVVTEAMKLAFADRDAFYADPNFVEVPIQELLSDEYTQLRRELITMQQASRLQQPGDPFHMRAELGNEPRDHREFSGFSNDTSNCLVADQWGNVVAATPSGWGGVQAGDSGVQLGSRMIGLTTWEGHPSVLAPGKRPRITLTPTLVMKNDRPVLAISVAGGDQQDQASIQIALNRLVFGFDTQASVQTPRFSTRHHIDWFGHLPFQPATLSIPRELEPQTEADLTQRGHEVSRARTAGAAVVLTMDPETQMKSVAADRGKQAVAY